MHVLGTAGHVDHGKSTLVHRLTGIHPDRLREERERQMTIDLGFAWMTLPGGEEVGIVDVPGHRDFIENMLAGVGGFEAALLVVAADEGVRPQTREHVAILDLMEIPRLLVALTKIDLVQDPEWLDLAEEEVSGFLAGTRFRGASVYPVSAASGAGTDELREGIAALLAGLPPRPDLGRPRLPIDRVFTMSGFGTVVTGTLIDGKLESGQAVEILPSRRTARVRGLQTHRRKIDSAVPGSRVAANLAGVEVRDLERGDVLTLPGTFEPTARIDVRVRALPGEGEGLLHRQEVKLFAGTAQTLARARVLGGERIRPGETGWVQFDLARPLAVARGDAIVVRQPSPGQTLAGGRIAEPRPARRYRRKDREVIEALERKLSRDPEDLFMEALRRLEIAPLEQAAEVSGLEPAVALAAAGRLHAQGRLESLEPPGSPLHPRSPLALTEVWRRWVERIEAELRRHHEAYPLRRGMSREELKSRLKFDARLLGPLLEALSSRGEIVDGSAWIAWHGHVPTLDDADRSRLEAWAARMRAAPYSPPSWKEGIQELGEELAAHYLESGQGTQVSADVVFEAPAYQAIVKIVLDAITATGGITVGDLRDRLGASRKYALAFLEHLDRMGITRREGDIRRLGASAPPSA